MSNNTILATAPLTATGYHLKATGTALGNSLIWDNGTNVGIGNTNTSYTLDVSGTLRSTTSAYFATTSGGVGIGISAPVGKLQVYKNGLSAVIGKMSDANILIDSGDYGINTYTSQIAFGYYSGTFTYAPVAIGFITTSGTGAGIGDLTFNTRAAAAGDAAPTERMRITSAGYVGINNTNPASRLYVQTTAGATKAYDDTTKTNIMCFDDTSMVAGVGGSITFGGYKTAQTNGGNFAAIDGVKENGTAGNEAGAFRIWTANSSGVFGERMRITSGGNVLIGGTSDIASGALVVGDNSSTRPLIIRGLNGVDASYTIGIGFYPWNTSESNAILNTVSSAASQSGFRFDVSNGGGSTARTASMYINRTSVTVVGALSAGTKPFLISHPLPNLKETHNLRHISVESPQAELIYRGKLTLVNGKAQANIDEIATMTEGTFEVLCREVQCFTTNESGWDLIKGKVIGNIIYIESQNTNSTDEISWMVIGERKDEFMMGTYITDENGKVLVESLKLIEPSETITN